MSRYQTNGWNTTDLTLEIMSLCATRAGLDINNDNVSERLYDICSDLEEFPEGEGFGTSDSYSYVQETFAEFEIEQ